MEGLPAAAAAAAEAEAELYDSPYESGAAGYGGEEAGGEPGPHHHQHHLLRHSLPDDERGAAALRHFGCDNTRQAIRKVNKMPQKALQVGAGGGSAGCEPVGQAASCRAEHRHKASRCWGAHLARGVRIPGP